MFERIRQIFERWHALGEIAHLDDRELQDLGVTRDQAVLLASMPADVPERLRAMAAIFGLPEADLQRDHATWLELTETCAVCGARPACQRMLEREHVFEGSVQPGDVGFCPNAANYRAMAKPAVGS